jgi:O-antigen/teichoic acid export membrane protein
MPLGYEPSLMASSNQLVRRLFSPAIFALGDQAVVSGANFLTMLFMARHLGLAAFGSFSLAYTSLLFLNNHHRSFFTQPLNVIGATEAPALLAERIGALAVLHLLWLPVGILTLVIAGTAFFPDPALIASAAVYFCFWQIQELIRRAWFTYSRVGMAFLGDFVFYMGQLCLVIGLATLSDLTGPRAFLAMAAAAATAVAVGFFQGIRLGHVSMSAIRRVASEHWTFGKWLVYGVFAIWGASQLYPFLLQIAGGAVLVGAFAASRNLLNGVGIFVQAINSYMPGKAKQIIAKSGVTGLRVYLFRNSWHVFVIAGLFCGGTAIWATEILHLVYGTSFTSASTALRILAIGTFAVSLTAVPTVGLMALDHTRTVFMSNLTGSAFTAAVGVPLVWQYGLEGAALAFSAGMLVVLMHQAFMLYRALRVSIT